MSAREHAQRFLDACPEDVRKAAEQIDRDNCVELAWASPETCVALIFYWNGEASWCPTFGSLHATHIDRLLQPTHPNSLASRIAAATDTQSQSGGSFIAAEPTHG